MSINKVSGYKNKKVLLTGSSGLLGAHLLHSLQGSCQNIRVFSRTPVPNLYPDVIPITGDINDESLLINALSGVDVVFHLAALVNIEKSIKQPNEAFLTNVLGTLRLLELARKMPNPPHIIFSGSTNIYKIQKGEMITEDHAFASYSDPYSTSKASADLICQSYIKTYQLPITILRVSTLYGPGQKITQFIPKVILQSISNPVLNLGSLYSYRDFSYVKDVVTAFLLAGIADECSYQAFNICSGSATCLYDIVKIISDLLGTSLELTGSNSYRSSEITYPFTMDNSKAKKTLHWGPFYDVNMGLKETVEWFKSNRI